MPSWLPALPYAQTGQRGYWQPVTSTINWCEEDYYATIYAAEFANTLTNVVFILLAVKGLLSCYRNGHDTVFAVAYTGYLAIGIGSALFHASLKYPMQLVDELSMIYTACIMAYAAFSYSRSTIFRIILAILLVVMSLFLTLYYHYLQDPAFHQMAFAFLFLTVLVYTMVSVQASVRPAGRRSSSKKAAEVAPQEPHDTSKSGPRASGDSDADARTAQADMWTLAASGMGLSLAAFAIWTLDNSYCSALRHWRRQLGLPWGLLLEGHGWWHIMTGLGAYHFILGGVWLRHCLNKRQDEYALVWPRIYNIPDIVRTKPGSKANSHPQGAGSKKTN